MSRMAAASSTLRATSTRGVFLIRRAKAMLSKTVM